MHVAYPQVHQIVKHFSCTHEGSRVLSQVLKAYARVEMDLLDSLLPSHEIIERAKEIVKRSKILKFEVGRNFSLNISFKDPARSCFQKIKQQKLFSSIAHDFLPESHKIKADHFKTFHFSFEDQNQKLVFQTLFHQIRGHFSHDLKTQSLQISQALRLLRKKSYLDDVFLHYKALEYLSDLKDPVFLVKPLLKQLIVDLERFPHEYLSALLHHLRNAESGFLKIIAAYVHQKLKTIDGLLDIPTHLEAYYQLLEFLKGSRRYQTITFTIGSHLERLLLVEFANADVLTQDHIFLRPDSKKEALFDLGYTQKSSFLAFLYLMKDEKNAKDIDFTSFSLQNWPDFWIRAVLCVSALQYNKVFLRWIILEIAKHHKQKAEFSFYVNGFFIRPDICDGVIRSYYNPELIKGLSPLEFRTILHRATSSRRFDLLNYFLRERDADQAFLRSEFEHMVKTDEAVLLVSWIEQFYDQFDEKEFLKPLYDHALRSLNDTIRSLFAQNFIYFAIGKGDIEKFSKQALVKYEAHCPKYRSAFYLSLLAKEGLWEVYDRVLKKESAGFIHQDDYELLMKLALTKNKEKFYEFFLSKDFSKDEMIAILPLVNQEMQGVDKAFFSHPRLQGFDVDDAVGFVFDMLKKIPHMSSVYPHVFNKAPFPESVIRQLFDLFAHRDQFAGLYVLKFSPHVSQDMWDGLILRYVARKHIPALTTFGRLGFPKLMPKHRTKEFLRQIPKEFYDKHVAHVFLDAAYQAQGKHSEFSTNGIKYQITSPLFDPRHFIIGAHHLKVENAKKA